MSVSGNLATMELQELLQWVSQFRKKGALVIRHGEYQRQLYFDAGRIVACASTDPAETLAAYLVHEELVDREALRRAAAAGPSRNLELGRALVEEGAMDEGTFRKALTDRIEQHVIEILSWAEGDFRFIDDLESEKRFARVAVDVPQLLLRAAHQIDMERASVAAEGTAGFEDVLGPGTFPESVDLPVDIPDVSRPSSRPAIVELTGVFPTHRRFASPWHAGLLAAGALLLLLGTWWLVPRSNGEGSVETRVGATQAGATQAASPIAVLEGSVEVVGQRAFKTLPAAAADPPGLNESTERVKAAELESLVAERTAEVAESVRSEYDRKIKALERELAAARTSAREPVGRTAPASTVSPGPSAAVSTARRDSDEPATPGTDSGRQAQGLKPKTRAVAVELGNTESTGNPETGDASSKLPSEPEPLAPTPPETSSEAEATASVGAETLRIPARLARPLRPQYPAQARGLGREADVVLRLRIEADGKVSEVEQVGTAVGFGIDRAALRAARASRWQAATEDGQLVASWAQVRIRFKPF